VASSRQFLVGSGNSLVVEVAIDLTTIVGLIRVGLVQHLLWMLSHCGLTVAFFATVTRLGRSSWSSADDLLCL
jgi:hypothetical protein